MMVWHHLCLLSALQTCPGVHPEDTASNFTEIMSYSQDTFKKETNILCAIFIFGQLLVHVVFWKYSYHYCQLFYFASTQHSNMYLCLDRKLLCIFWHSFWIDRSEWWCVSALHYGKALRILNRPDHSFEPLHLFLGGSTAQYAVICGISTYFFWWKSRYVTLITRRPNWAAVSGEYGKH